MPRATSGRVQSRVAPIARSAGCFATARCADAGAGLFIHTGRYSIADIASGVSLCALRDYMKFDLSAYRGMTAWLSRLEGRDLGRELFGRR